MPRGETVRLAEKIIRRLRTATDAGKFGDAMRFDIEFPTRLDYRGGNGIVSAAGAERRNFPLIIAAREPARVATERGVMKFRFCDVRHERATLPDSIETTFRLCISLPIAPPMNRAV